MSRQKSGHDATELPLRQRCVVVFTVLTCGLVAGLLTGRLVPATSSLMIANNRLWGIRNDKSIWPSDATEGDEPELAGWILPKHADSSSAPSRTSAAPPVVGTQGSEAVTLKAVGALQGGVTGAAASRVWPLPGGGPSNLYVSDGTATRFGGDSCMVTEGGGGGTGKFEVVLLSTYPRSGNSWTKMLVKGGTQITYDLSTVRPTSLFKLGEFVKCKSCAASTIALYMQSVLSIRFGRQPFGDSMGHKVKGIGQDRQHLQETRAATQECADSFVAYKWMEAAGQAWPFGPDHFAPVMIKSHYPMIGTGDARTISYFATKIIHLVRNPFDNLASRYMGEGRKFKGRFNALTRAVAKGQTTEVFEKFLAKDIQGYVHFHEYWLERRKLDIANGTSTFYTRYESLCASTKEVMTSMLNFGGWNITQPSFACTLKEIPCEYDLNEMPGQSDNSVTPFLP